DVAFVLHVLPTHLTREEAGRGEVAEAAEKDHAVAHRRPRLLWPRNVIEQLPALRVRGADERLAEAVLGFVIEPGETALYPGATGGRRLLVRHEEVDELRNFGVRRASGPVVARNDVVDEEPNGGPLVRV